MNWIHDVRTALEAELRSLDHVGLPRWLGVVWKEDGSPRGDDRFVEALGLKGR